MKHLYTVDLSVDKSKYSQYLSNTLLSHIENSLQNNKKTILYLNKRGAYDLLICSDCNYLQKCPKCDIALSVHKKPPILMCHHCSYTQEIPLECEKCGNTNLKKVGVGTQQIEEVLYKIFPHIKIFRLDSDNVKNNTLKKEALQNILDAHVIIGTKMITTGFDFRNIGVIGVILIEQELQIPRYDTEERIYQNIKQLIGRGGRVGQETNIIIQTLIPNNELIKNITELNYKEFLLKTLEERKTFHYPPFEELATLRYKHVEKEKTQDFIDTFEKKLLSINDGSVEITKVDTLSKRDNQYFGKIILKGKNIRNFLQPVKKDILSHKDLVVIFE